MLLYVDDIILASDCSELLQEVKELLMSSFNMKFLGELHSFLGIKIDRSPEGIFLNQSYYFEMFYSVVIHLDEF